MNVNRSFLALGLVGIILFISGCGGDNTSSKASTATAPEITSQPRNQTVTAQATATFSVTATGTSLLSYQWQKNGANIDGATAANYTTPTVSAQDSGALFSVVLSNGASQVTSRAAKLTVNSAVSASGTVNVLTYHNDNARTGQNLQETVLTPANVNASSFGKIGFDAVDGKVDAQPLYVSGLTVAGSKHNVLFVVTEHGSAYAFDADSGAQLWHVSVLGSHETPSDPRNCGQVVPEIGVTATPVIDLSTGPHGTIYIVAMSKDGTGNYYQRLHALDITTGAEQTDSPRTIQASYPGTGDNSSNGNVMFAPEQHEERAGLLLLNGIIYTSWTSHCDIRPYTGWIIGYDAKTLAQQGVFDTTPNGSDGSIWASGAGPAADSSGNIYALISNGTFDTMLDSSGFPSRHDYGNAFIKLATAGSELSVADYFTMSNEVSESAADQDLGSGGALVLPDLKDAAGHVRYLAPGAGKDQTIYVVDRNDLGKFDPNKNNIYQELPDALHGPEFGMPAYFNQTIYYGAVGDTIRAFKIDDARLSTTPSSQTASSFDYPGTTPGISANGSVNGIVWAVENSSPAVLHAYTAAELTDEIYNSNQAPNGRDHFGPGNKFITPTIANGKVYVGTQSGVAVFGLLH